MSEKLLKDLDRRISEATAQVRRLRLLIERQRQGGAPTDESEVLIGEVESYIAQLRAHRRALVND